jgi:hypothetical protein
MGTPHGPENPHSAHVYFTLWSLQLVHLPIVVLPQLGQGKVVSEPFTSRIPQEEQTFSWLLKPFYLGAEEYAICI